MPGTGDISWRRWTTGRTNPTVSLPVRDLYRSVSPGSARLRSRFTLVRRRRSLSVGPEVSARRGHNAPMTSVLSATRPR